MIEKGRETILMSGQSCLGVRIYPTLRYQYSLVEWYLIRYLLDNTYHIGTISILILTLLPWSYRYFYLETFCYVSFCVILDVVYSLGTYLLPVLTTNEFDMRKYSRYLIPWLTTFTMLFTWYLTFMRETIFLRFYLTYWDLILSWGYVR